MLNIKIILLSILVFLFVILSLVSLLIYIRNKFLPKGKVKIVVNENKIIEVQPGNNLLFSLSENNIFLPSACGGGGTCGLCRCQVLDGGGTILPTEVGFFSRKEIENKWRLSCQVKVRNDIKIKIPEEILEIKKFECEVISNRNVATFIKEFIVKVPDDLNFDFRPGGYVQIYVPRYELSFKDIYVEPEYKDEWDKYNLWDLKVKNNSEIYRAYSMANHPAEGRIIMLNIRIATPPFDKKTGKFKNVSPGICSSYLFSRKPGDKVTISGPYGEFFIKETNREMVYIGGGAGMAPLRSHIFHLFYTMKTNRKVSYWYGARSKREIFYEEDFRKIEKEFPNFSFHVALSEPKPEDNWEGLTGFIHQVVYDEYLSKHKEPEEIEYYLCGPKVMIEAVLKMLDNLGVPKEMIAFDDFGS